MSVVVNEEPSQVVNKEISRDVNKLGRFHRVLIVTADTDPPYQRPPLTKEMLAGEEKVHPKPIDEQPWPEAISLRLNTEVTAVDAQQRTIWYGPTGKRRIRYAALVVAVGSRPRPLPGVDDEATVHLLRSLNQARKLVATAEKARSAVVVGSGFIGCEAAASLAAREVHTTIDHPRDHPTSSEAGPESRRTPRQLVALRRGHRPTPRPTSSV